MGGPQAGIIAGKKEYLDLLKKHPLMRALRVDKLTLAALEATLKLYRDPPTAARNLPLYQMLSQPMDTLWRRAEALKELLDSLPGTEISIIESQGQVGGGSAPGETIPSVALALQASGVRVDQLHKRLLCAPCPIVARISADRLILDMRTIPDSVLPLIAETLHSVM